MSDTNIVSNSSKEKPLKRNMFAGLFQRAKDARDKAAASRDHKNNNKKSSRKAKLLGN